ncbi:MAG: HIT domain-containing protein [Clostridia bacterium]|nr:HIT domain-containing protein [Clostridia bacterium]
MENCIFCKILNGEIPSKRLYEDDKVIVIMDVNPKVDGHSLVIPKEHVSDFKEASNELISHMFDVARVMTDKLMTKLDAKAITLGINYGDSQVVKHLHLHLLPNFEIKEVSMSVDEVYDILKED